MVVVIRTEVVSSSSIAVAFFFIVLKGVIVRKLRIKIVAI